MRGETKTPGGSCPRDQGGDGSPCRYPLLPRASGIQAKVGILAPEPRRVRLQLRDSAGLTPDFPHFSLAPSDEALRRAFNCARHPTTRGADRQDLGALTITTSASLTIAS